MSEQEERIERSTTHFVFTGQPVSEWPNWMVFLNFAYDGHSKILVHRLDDILEIRLGDIIARKSDGQLSIIRGNILRFPERTPILENTAADRVVENRIETAMTL